MDKEERHAFLRWLSSASREEIKIKLIKFSALSSQLREENSLSEVRWLINEITGEIAARDSLGL